MELIKPLEIAVTDRDGVAHTYTISRLPALDARRVIAMYPVSNMPKVGDYQSSEEAMLLLLKYVEHDGVRLVTRALVDNHVADGVALINLEYQMLEYNTGFFGSGGQRGLLSTLIANLSDKAMPILTRLLEQYLAQDKPRSKK